MVGASTVRPNFDDYSDDDDRLDHEYDIPRYFIFVHVARFSILQAARSLMVSLGPCFALECLDIRA